MAIIPITKDEWNSSHWTELTGQIDFEGDRKIVCIRGPKKTSPPDDGYHYIEVTTYSDSEQKWARAVEIVED